ncbi:MAG: nodulation protein NodH [Paracoccaceae bacterium]
MTLEQREADPLPLLALMRRQGDTLAGFRFFHDHDPRVLDHVLADPRCAKIVLTRNPLDSYLSRKIVAQTNQWRLSDAKHRKTATVRFDADEFGAHLESHRDFQRLIQGALQKSGQTAFYLSYEDVGSLAVMNGLGSFLGAASPIEKLSTALVVQNPGPAEEKVSNPAEMAASLAQIDWLNLGGTPNFEPERGPAVPSFVAAATAPLLYLPVRGGDGGQVRPWLAALGDGAPLQTGFTQKTLRQWLRAHHSHRSFTVVCHPLTRAHRAFCDVVHSGRNADMAAMLTRRYAVPLPEDGATAPRREHRAAFLAFLRWLKQNLAGQTSLRIDPVWASQSAVVKGFGEFLPPQAILREEELANGLANLAADLGLADVPAVAPPPPHGTHDLADFVDDELQSAARAAYPRDFEIFGYGDWLAPAAA